jgi:hypothetical protein
MTRWRWRSDAADGAAARREAIVDRALEIFETHGCDLVTALARATEEQALADDDLEPPSRPRPIAPGRVTRTSAYLGTPRRQGTIAPGRSTRDDARANADALEDPFGIHLPQASPAGTPTTDRVDSLVASFAQPLGLPAESLIVRTDDEARRRTRAHGTRGLAEDGIVYLDADRFDPHTADGMALIGHELAHLAQARIAAGPGEGTYEQAEDEARAIGAQLAAGGPIATPKVAYARAAAEDPAPAKQPEHTLPDGENIGFLSDGTLIVRTEWITAGGAITPAKKEGEFILRNREKMREILTKMRAAGLFWWMTDAQKELIAQRFFIEGKSFVSGKKFFTSTWTPDVFKYVGPPPGAAFYFVREDDAVYGFFRADAFPAPQSPDPVSTQLTPEQKTAFLDGLDKHTNLVSDDAARAWWMGKDSYVDVYADRGGAYLYWSRLSLDRLYGRDRVQHFLDKKQAPARPTKNVPTGAGKVVRYDGTISDADAEFASRWLEQTKGAMSTWGGGLEISDQTIHQFEIDQMRKIDAHPLRPLIMQKLRERGGELDYGLLDWAINAAEYEKAARDTGQTEVGAGGARWYDTQVDGFIRFEGLAYPGRDMRIWFQVTSKVMDLVIPIVHTRWVLEKKVGEGKWEQAPNGVGNTTEVATREPDVFNYTFTEIGTYRIHAFVNHNLFYPRHFPTPGTEAEAEIVVKTEDERVGEVKKSAFGDGFGGKVGSKDKKFDTSVSTQVLGKDRYTNGLQLDGTLPDDFQRVSEADRLKFLSSDKEHLKDLIKKYGGDDKPYSLQRIASYAQDRLESLEEQEKKIGAERNAGFVFFDARAAFLSRTPGVSDSPLRLVGSAKGEPEKMSLKVHDFTRLFEPEDFTFEGSSGGFDTALEIVFMEMCHRYPAGKLSLLCEFVNNANVPQKRTVGFEKDTDNVEKVVRRTVWDPGVQLAVNLAGAAAMIFYPPSAMIVLPVLGAYNSLETVNTMVDLETSGNLTWQPMVRGGIEIGLNILPIVGEAVQIGKIGGIALFGFHAANVGGMVALMTWKGWDQAKTLQGEHVLKVANLIAEIEDLQKKNESSPKLERLKADLERAKEDALQASMKVFREMSQSLALILIPTIAMSKISKAMAGRNIEALIAEGKFEHTQPGEVPHYDAQLGKMRGDKALLTPEILEELKQAYASDHGLRQIQLEKTLGTDKVELSYRKDAKDITVTYEDGKYRIEAPEGTPIEKLQEKAWARRQAVDPRAPRYMPTLELPRPETTTPGPTPLENGERPRASASKGGAHPPVAPKPSAVATMEKQLVQRAVDQMATAEDPIARNTYEAIKDHRVKLKTRAEVQPIDPSDPSVCADPANHDVVIDWNEGHAHAFGDVVYVDPINRRGELVTDLIHEVNHALDHANWDARSNKRSFTYFMHEFNAHWAQGMGKDAGPNRYKVIVDYLLDNYKVLKREFDHTPGFKERVNSIRGPEGNYVSSPRLADVFHAMEVHEARQFDTGYAFPTTEGVAKMLEPLDVGERQILARDRLFQRWLEQDIGLDPADVAGLRQKYGIAPVDPTTPVTSAPTTWGRSHVEAAQHAPSMAEPDPVTVKPGTEPPTPGPEEDPRGGRPKASSSAGPGGATPQPNELRPKVDPWGGLSTHIVRWQKWWANVRRPRWEVIEATSVNLNVQGEHIVVVMVRNEGGSGMNGLKMIADACAAVGVPRPRTIRGTRIVDPRIQGRLQQHAPGTRLTAQQVREIARPGSVLAAALGAEVAGAVVIEAGEGRSLVLELTYGSAAEGGRAPSRAAAALEAVGVPASTVAKWGDQALANLSQAETVAELEAIAPLVKAGRVKGIGEWLEFGANKTGADAVRTAGELRDARRRAAENPGAIMNVGGDAHAPNDRTTGNKLPSFDMTMETPGGTIQRSVEVGSVDGTVNKGADLVVGVGHAADKVAVRNLKGEPIPGAHDATIRATVAKEWRQGKAGTVEIQPNGDRVRITKDGQRIAMTNIFDELTGKIADSPNHVLLDRIAIVDSTTGAILAEYQRSGSIWGRLR